MLNPNFSSRALRRIRAERGLSRQQLADAVRCHKSAVQRWEQGLRTPNNQALMVAASVLGCTVEDLLVGSEVAK